MPAPNYLESHRRKLFELSPENSVYFLVFRCGENDNLPVRAGGAEERFFTPPANSVGIRVLLQLVPRFTAL